MKNNIIFGAILVIIAFSLSYTFIKPVQNIVNETVGSVTGPDDFYPCKSTNGVTTCSEAQSPRSATTTVCAFKSPAATSTLVRGLATFRVGTSSAYTVHMAKAATFNATTTSLGYAVVAAGAQVTVTASTTNIGITPNDQPWIFAPNQWFVVGFQGGIGPDVAGTGFVPVGSCDAIFQII